MENIIEEIKEAVSANKDSVSELRNRIRELLSVIPVGTALKDEQGEVCSIVSMYTGASQWSNRTWDVTIRGWGAITPGQQIICEDLASRKSDGNNIHYRLTEPTMLGEPGDDRSEIKLRWASVADTRAIARRLPAAIAAYMASLEADTAENLALAV